MSAISRLLGLAAVAEAATGAGLLTVPALVGRLLLGAEVSGVAISIARVTGIALIALGVACWPDRNPMRTLSGMMFYSLLVTLYLAWLGIDVGGGILLWPAVAAHAALSVMFVRAWRQGRPAGEARE